MERKSKTCAICAITYQDNQYQYYSMGEIKSIYIVHGFKFTCQECGYKANKFINYYGRKKPEDLKKLNDFLCGGVLVRRKFEAMMNGGYWS